MSTSQLLQQLSTDAHSLGDIYYRRLTDVSRTDDGIDPETKELARSYHKALSNLLVHLESLGDFEKTAEQKKTTLEYIKMVETDLGRFDGRARSKS